MARFNGSDYVPPRDDERLTRQLDRVKACMIDGRWRTLDQITAATGDPQSSVSAQLRHLRKEKHGSYRVEKEYAGEGLFLYRLLPPLEPGQLRLLR